MKLRNAERRNRTEESRMEWKQLSIGYHGKKVEMEKAHRQCCLCCSFGEGLGGNVVRCFRSSDSSESCKLALAFSQLNSMTVLKVCEKWADGWSVLSMFFFNKSLALAIFSHKVVSKQTKKRTGLW